MARWCAITVLVGPLLIAGCQPTFVTNCRFPANYSTSPVRAPDGTLVQPQEKGRRLRPDEAKAVLLAHLAVLEQLRAAAEPQPNGFYFRVATFGEDGCTVRVNCGLGEDGYPDPTARRTYIVLFDREWNVRRITPHESVHG